MYLRSFPRCTISGSVDPVPFKHMGQEGAVPKKCSECQCLFEGECLRAADQGKGFLALDHGPCPVKGETTPVLFDNRYFQSKVAAPAKCGSCSFLSISVHEGFTCTFEQEKWGAFPRELDWGDWSPELPDESARAKR